MSERQFTGYDRGQLGEAVHTLTARLEAICAMPGAPRAEARLAAFDALWAASSHVERVTLREIMVLKLLKVM